MRRLIALLIAGVLFLFFAAAYADEILPAGDAQLPLDLPVFENESFHLTELKTREIMIQYCYTFEGTGMDAQTILSLMSQTGHTLVDYSVDPLAESEGTGHSIYYTYAGDSELTLFPVGTPEGMFSVVIGFKEYADGTCKMTLFCSPELAYEAAE